MRTTMPVLFGTLLYTVVTFGLAVVWHVLIFEDQYRTFGYFDGEPKFAIGLAAILIQGIILSALYPLIRLQGTSLTRGLKYAAFVGVFFWTSHVLAFVAKQTVEGAGLFLMMETVYLVLQFGIFGVAIGWVYGRWGSASG